MRLSAIGGPKITNVLMKTRFSGRAPWRRKTTP